jgi:phage shock protein A
MADIDLQNLEDKIKVLDEDIQKVNDLLVKLERDKVNALATMNALQGAKSQCVTLIKELHNDEDQAKSASSDDS